MYPLTLLPLPEYKIAIDCDCFSNDPTISLIRRVDKSYDEVYDEDVDSFFPVVFERAKSIPGLSLNLLCIHCDKNSTDYKTQGDGSKYWDGREIDIKSRSGEYIPTGIHTNVYLNFMSVDNLPVPLLYEDSVTKRKELAKNKITGLTEAVNSEGKKILLGNGTLRVVHKPTNLNYWHYELSFEAENKTNVKNPNNAVTEALDYILDHMMSASVCSINPFGDLNFDPQNCYLKAV